MNHLLRVTPLLFSAELPATLHCFFFCLLSFLLSVWGMKQVEEGNGHIGGWRTERGRTARFGADTAKLILHRLITGWPPPAHCLFSLFPNCHTPAVKHACTHVTSFSRAPAFVSLCFLLIFHPACCLPALESLLALK